MPMVSKKVKQSQSDDFVLWAVVLTLGVVLAGFAIAWFYFKGGSAPVRATTAYSSIGPLVVRTSGYSLKTSLALQTSPGDAAGVDASKAALTAALQDALSNANAEAIRAPDGLQALQGALRTVANSTLKNGSVQDVLLTDFVLQTN